MVSFRIHLVEKYKFTKSSIPTTLWQYGFYATYTQTMMTILLLGLALSLDNFRVVLALAAAGMTRRLTARIVIGFILFEAIMPVVGLLIGDGIRASIEPLAEWLGVAALAGSGIYIIASVLRHGLELPNAPWFVLGLPLILSMDNLIAGVGLGLLGQNPVTVGVLFAAATALTCAVGLAAGEIAARLQPQVAQYASGLALIGFSALEVLSWH